MSVSDKAVAWAVKDHADGTLWVIVADESVAARLADEHDDTVVPLYTTPPAQAAEAVERVARALATFDAERVGACPDTNLGMNEAYYTSLARAAIAAMPASGEGDTARLDWLDKVSAGTIRMDRYDLPGVPGALGICPDYTHWGPTEHYAHRTARAAIDAARGEGNG